MTQKLSLPLGEQIKQAENLSDLNAILAIAETYIYASERTKNRWRTLAARRKLQFQKQERR